MIKQLGISNNSASCTIINILYFHSVMGITKSLSCITYTFQYNSIISPISLCKRTMQIFEACAPCHLFLYLFNWNIEICPIILNVKWFSYVNQLIIKILLSISKGQKYPLNVILLLFFFSVSVSHISFHSHSCTHWIGSWQDLIVNYCTSHQILFFSCKPRLFIVKSEI